MSNPARTDRAEDCLAQIGHSEKNTYGVLSAISGEPLETLHFRDRGRPGIRRKAEDQQSLTTVEEDVLVKCFVQRTKEGYPIRVKFIQAIVHAIIAHRNSILPLWQPLQRDDIKPPGKNWPFAFRDRHEELKDIWSMLLKGRVLNQHSYDSIDAWLKLIEPELNETKLLKENTYNIIVVGFVLGLSDSLKDITSGEVMRGCINSKESMITAIECINAEGVGLNPKIIWPSGTPQRSSKYNPTPDWNHELSKYGHLDKNSLLHWVEKVFDPQTKARASGRPRRLIGDIFLDINSREIVQYCFKNNIQICRLQLHPVRGIQEDPVGFIEALKIEFYKGLGQRCLDRAKNPRTKYLDKELFSLSYDHARQAALTTPYLLSSWNREEERLIDQIQEPRKSTEAIVGNNHLPCSSRKEPTAQLPATPNFSIIAEDLVCLRKGIESDKTYRMLSTTAKARIIHLAETAEMAFVEIASLQQQHHLLERRNEMSSRIQCESTADYTDNEINQVGRTAISMECSTQEQLHGRVLRAHPGIKRQRILQVLGKRSRNNQTNLAKRPRV